MGDDGCCDESDCVAGWRMLVMVEAEVSGGRVMCGDKDGVLIALRTYIILCV